jgi:hypothetical protein
LVTANPNQNVSVRFTADTPLSSSEVIDVYADNGTIEPDDFTSLQASFASYGNVTLAQSESIGGSPAYLLAGTAVLDYTNQTVYVRQALINCNAARGPFWVSITATIPDSLIGDVSLADYMIDTMEC